MKQQPDSVIQRSQRDIIFRRAVRTCEDCQSCDGKGARSAVGSVSVADDDRAALVEPGRYLMPVRIEDASPATVSGSSGVVYMAINVANFDRPSDMFAALYMGDWRMATWYKFPQGMDHSRIGNFSDDHEGWINMLRYGEKGNKDTRVEDEGRGTYEDADVSAYVQWVADEYNTFE